MTTTPIDLTKLSAQEIVNLLPLCIDCHQHKVGVRQMPGGWICEDCELAVFDEPLPGMCRICDKPTAG